ncbi:MAG: peptidase S41 [Muribaculaceae bacterium]|nr:peptidase S41 [Muribaculaceae bacterium]
MKKLILSIAAMVPFVASAVTPMWLRDAKISPDGSCIAFTYKGDIWTVPTSGGQATRITATPDYEANPVWSPDSRRLAFAGDAAGNIDVYVVDAVGGAPVRLTFNSASEIPESFTPDGKNVLFSAAIQDPAESAMFPTARMTELYSVPVSGGTLTQVLATPARFVSYLPGGNGSFLYQDVKGHEDEWRKHHTSSVTRDIWLYDANTGKHTNLTLRGGEDTNPVAVNASDFVFLSERNGSTVNVYEASITEPSNAKALTSFATHPVRFLSRADNGTLALTYDGELYTMKPGATPVKVSVDLIDSDTNPVKRLNVAGARGAVASPDGKSVAFIYRGNVFVTSVEYPTTKQITTTPEAEGSVSWSPDSKSLIYTSERDGKFNIYKATIAREGEEPNFANATLIKEEALFKPDGHERTMAELSPDGKKLAFILDRTKLAVMDMESGKVKELTDGSTHRQRGGGFGYTWSPDSKWIALEIVDRMHDPYYDVAIINVDNGKMTNLTNSGYFDESPRWALDGNALIFASERYGMRNHASWGSEMDVMIVFMNRDSYDRFRLSPEDYAIVKDLDKKNKKGGDKKEDADDDSEVKAINVELDGIEDRVMRLTPMSSDLSSYIITDDGETLYYITQGQDKKQLWKIGLRKDEVKLVGNVDGASDFDSSSDGKTLFIFGSSMKKLDPKSDKMTPITTKATMELDQAAEREFMFDNISREVSERFYTANMHGVDWPAMTAAYRKFLPHINNNYDFAELVSEWLGELNVSHTGGRYSGRSLTLDDDRTATLGLIFDLNHKGNGLKVAEIIAKGPFDRALSELRPGYIIESIDGQPVSFNSDYTTALNNKIGKKTLVSFYNPADGRIIEEVILPISTAKQNSLLYDRWVKARAAEVDRLSNGRLGYVHIQSMGDDSFRKVYSDVLGKYNDREGIVIDIRWNGGGRLHEDIEILFSGKKYFTQEIRGDKTCDMPSRRWNKPSIMLMSEACYSNAHGTPWVYKHRNLGKLVGMPVPGTMTSVNWVTMQDPSLVFGIPVVGYRLADGSVLENQQLEPDIKVANDPATVVKGEDLQLKAAVEELLREIDAR